MPFHLPSVILPLLRICSNSRTTASSSLPSSHLNPIAAMGVSLRQRDISDLNILIAPLVEELDASNLIGDILWKDGVGLCDLLDLGSLVVRHDCGCADPLLIVERLSLGWMSASKSDSSRRRRGGLHKKWPWKRKSWCGPTQSPASSVASWQTEGFEKL